MSIHKVDFDKIPWETPMKGVRAKSVVRDGKRLRLVEYTPEMDPHWCESGHFGRIIEGRFEIQFGDEKVIYEPGDGVFIPSGKNDCHRGRALTSVVRVIFVEDV
jgi:ethanolamine utilization protein EutQ (cupin superfamily)